MAIRNNPNPNDIVKAIKDLETVVSTPRYIERTIGDGATKSFVITHNWNVNVVHVTIVDLKDNIEVIADVEQYPTYVVINFTSAPTDSQYCVLVSNPRL